MKTAKANMSTPAVGSLAERAMIVRLNISRWSAMIIDGKAAKALAVEKKAAPGMVHLQKRLLEKGALTAINVAENVARDTHKAMTLPWTDGGYRILSAKAYFAYTEAMRKCEDQFKQAVNDFIAKYPAYHEKAKELLGELGRESEYPETEAALRRKHAFNVRFFPIPTSDDFRVQIDSATCAVVKSQIEEDLREAFAAGMRSVWQRLYNVVRHLAEQLKGDGAVYASSVEHIRKLLDLLPSLNVLDDPKLTKMGTEIAKALIVDPADLRSDEAVRGQTADEAEKILKKIEQFI